METALVALVALVAVLLLLRGSGDRISEEESAQLALRDAQAAAVRLHVALLAQRARGDANLDDEDEGEGEGEKPPLVELLEQVGEQLFEQMESGRGQVNDVCRASLIGGTLAATEALHVDAGIRDAWGAGSRQKAEALIAFWTGLTVSWYLRSYGPSRVHGIVVAFVDDSFDGRGEHIWRLVESVRTQDEAAEQQDTSGRYFGRTTLALQMANLEVLGRDTGLLARGYPPFPLSIDALELVNSGVVFVDPVEGLRLDALRTVALRAARDYLELDPK